MVSRTLSSFDVVLFLDADIGVVNPSRKIEEFLVDNIDLTFYDRFQNWEIATGSYIARNTEYSRELLLEFANYESKLRNSFHGSDNGAIHMFLAEKLLRNSDGNIEICKKIYEKSKDFEDLLTFEVCIRELLNNENKTDFGKIRIMKKGTGWVRDGWLTNGLWSPDLDFMIHGWKMEHLREVPKKKIKLDRPRRNVWYNPFDKRIDLKRCVFQNFEWSFDSRLIRDKKELLEALELVKDNVKKMEQKSRSRITEFY